MGETARTAATRAGAPLRVHRRHLVTYTIGNAIAWILWASVSVSADAWYWWLAIPLVAWSAVLAGHLWTTRPSAAPPESVRRVRAAALLLVAGLLAGPVSTHVYWMFGGTWGLYTRGVRDEVATTGIRVVAAVVVLLLVAAILVVLARVGYWRQAIVPDRLIRLFAWALAAVFVLETVAAFTWSRGEELWWLYGPVSLVLALLALVVAGSGTPWPHVHGPHRTMPSH